MPQESVKIILLTDVTETRALQELVARNQRLSAIGKMAASLAHQIRTPLAGALLYLSQCRSRRDERERGKLLEKGIERLRHLDRLVQDMLVFARGKGPGERVRVADLFRAVHDAAMAVKPPNAHLDHRRHRRARRARRQPHRADGRADESRSATPSKPRPTSSLRCTPQLRGDRVEFTVHDNGPGIAPSIQSRVFEPFFSTRPAGTGLGLAVVKTVAEAHGGELGAALASPGAAPAFGSTCRASRRRAAAPRGARAPERSHEPTGTILVVEDDRPLQDALVTTLASAGFKVLAAATAAKR